MNKSSEILYPVMETFYSIQGEAFYTGTAAWFIRLAGCDVGCHWCDVKESWDVNASPKIAVEKLVQDVVDAGAPIAIITGGEPAMHNLEELTKRLQDQKIKTHIETSGVHLLTGQWDWVCFSPKKFKKPMPVIYQAADELKIVICNKHDLLWAEEHAKLLPKTCKLFLQPEWDKRDSITPVILNYIRENPKWRLSLQTHKYLGIP